MNWKTLLKPNTLKALLTLALSFFLPIFYVRTVANAAIICNASECPDYFVTVNLLSPFSYIVKVIEEGLSSDRLMFLPISIPYTVFTVGAVYVLVCLFYLHRERVHPTT